MKRSNKKSKSTWNKWKWKHNSPKPFGYSKRDPKIDVYSITGLPQEARKISNKLPNLTPKGGKNKKQKEQQTKPQTSRRKEIIKIRAEISDIETKPNKTKPKKPPKSQNRSMKPGASSLKDQQNW